MFRLVYRMKEVFERVGAPWNIYLLDDVVSGDLPKFRCYFFLNCFHMTDFERAYLQRELQGGGRTLVWMYAPGYVSDTDLDVNRISALTGMDFVELEETRPWRIKLLEGHPLTEGVPDSGWPQPDHEIGPIFHPRAEGLEVAGLWEGTDQPGLALRRADDWTSVYSAGPMLSVRMVKNLCKLAGVPVVVEGADPSYVTGNFVALHSAVPRTEHLSFARPARVTDLLSGEVLAERASELAVAVPGPGTLLLRTEPAR